jgi:hypothetical protein
LHAVAAGPFHLLDSIVYALAAVRSVAAAYVFLRGASVTGYAAPACCCVFLGRCFWEGAFLFVSFLVASPVPCRWVLPSPRSAPLGLLRAKPSKVKCSISLLALVMM